MKRTVAKPNEDGWFTSDQSSEFGHFVDAMRAEFKRRTPADVEIAICMARRQIKPREGIGKLAEQVRLILKH